MSAGADGTDMTIKRDGKVLAFDDWTAFINPVSEDQAVYCKRAIYLMAGES